VSASPAAFYTHPLIPDTPPDKELAKGDIVKVVKVGKQTGNMAKVLLTESEFGGRVKVCMVADGSTKSYLPSELEAPPKPHKKEVLYYILYSYCTYILYSYCTHTVPIYCTHTVLILEPHKRCCTCHTQKTQF
jgi:hypothetical protein